jgi:transcriptional regulator with XRE-family HTH domain
MPETHEQDGSGAVARSPADVERLWQEWMSGFGRHVRRVREFLGLSQVELARRAGVSQVAISRFESGRGLNTALVVALRISLALARALKVVDPEVLADDVQRFVEHMDFLALPDDPEAPPLPGGVPVDRLTVTVDPDLERLARLYRELPPARRSGFLRTIDVLAVALRE